MKYSKNGILVAIALCTTILSSIASAQQTGTVSPNIGAGKKRAAVCFACHGTDGVSKVPGTPHLAGQDRVYLEKALHAYRGGQLRQDPTMSAMAKPLTDADIVNIAGYFSYQAKFADGKSLAQVTEANERIRPVGISYMEAAPSTSSSTDTSKVTVLRSADIVYKEACVACHGTGAAGAPKLGDKADWAKRLSQGKPTLLEHALQGYKGMPAKGGCNNCSNEEIKSVVDYLVEKSK
jgi:cytochrome c5